MTAVQVICTECGIPINNRVHAETHKCKSPRPPIGKAPTDNGIEELDALCERYNAGEINLTSLVSDAWNKGYHAGTKGL